MYNRGKKGDATLVIGISILFSVLLVVLVIAIFPLKVEKKPLYLLTGISGLLVLFAAFSANVLAWWYGIIVFVGLLFALSILIGKKSEWIKPIHRKEEEKTHKPFSFDYKQPGIGQSIFDEEAQQVMGKGMLAARLREKKSESEHHFIPESPILPNEVESEVMREEQEEGMTETPNDYIENDSEREDYPLQSDDEIAASSVYFEDLSAMKEELEEEGTIPSLEVEELSDEWLKTRLDALYGEGTSAHIVEQNNVDLSIDSYISYLENDEELDMGHTPSTTEDVEYEDLSNLYYNELRGEDDGTTE